MPLDLASPAILYDDRLYARRILEYQHRARHYQDQFSDFLILQEVAGAKRLFRCAVYESHEFRICRLMLFAVKGPVSHRRSQ